MKKNKANIDGHIVGIALFILPLAFFGGMFFTAHPQQLDFAQYTNWYINYDQGYVHRGLMGSILRFFHGPPDVEIINRVVPSWEFNILLFEIVFFWALLVAPIFLHKFDPPTKRLLLAFAAVILLAPIWRNNTIHVGFMDEWVLLFVLFGFVAAFVVKNPIIYFFSITPAFFVHPQAIFYALLMSMLIIHAVLRNPVYTARWRMWLAVIVLKLSIPLLLYFLHSPERIVDVIAHSLVDIGASEDMKIGMSKDFANPVGWATNRVLTVWDLWFSALIMSITVFGLPVLALGLLFATSLGKWINYPGWRTPYPRRILPSVADFLSRWDAHIMLAVTPFITLPMNTVAVDSSRFLYWGWWNIGLVIAYFIWTSGNGALPPPPRKTKKKIPSDRLPALTGLTVLLFVWAYTFLGAPLNVNLQKTPWVFTCQRWCVFPLTNNPLGKGYSDAVLGVLLHTSTQDVRGDGQSLLYMKPVIGERGVTADESGALIVPADYQGKIFEERITLSGRNTLVFTLRHESNGPPPVIMQINNQPVQPVRQTADETIWQINIPNMSIYIPKVSSSGGKDFKVFGFAIEFKR